VKAATKPKFKGLKLIKFTFNSMSEEQMIAFQDKLQFDEELAKRVESAIDGEVDTTKEIDDIIAIAKDAGFDITAADVLKSQARLVSNLSDEELEAVAGGFGKRPPMPGQQTTGSMNFGGGCGIYGDPRNTGWGKFIPGFGFR
jgi:predicted ribosomally synthesized peptide with nif11-like leader